MRLAKTCITLALPFTFLYGLDNSSVKNSLNNQNAVATKSEITKSFLYKEGLNSFMKSDFQKSFDSFGELILEDPSNEKVNFYYGRSAFELKQYEFAFSAFDRILILNPNNQRARLEYARTLFMMKAYKQSKKEFNKVLASPIPKEVRQNVEKFVALIDTNEKSYILHKVAILGFGWDNNVDNNTYESVTFVNGLPLSNDTEKKEDYHFRAVLIGNLIVPFKSNNKLAWESTAIAYMQEQKRYHKNDLFLGSFTSGIAYLNKNYKNLTSFSYDHIWLDGDQTLYMYGIGNSLKYMFPDKRVLSLDVKYKKKQMIKTLDRDKNSDSIELSLAYSIPLRKIDTLNFFISHLHDRKTKGSRTDISKDSNKLKISYDKTVYGVDFSLGYELETVKYKVRSFNLPMRRDNKKNISLRASKKVSKTDILAVEFNHIDNNSNINTYSYKKRNANLSYTIIF